MLRTTERDPIDEIAMSDDEFIAATGPLVRTVEHAVEDRVAGALLAETTMRIHRRISR